MELQRANRRQRGIIVLLAALLLPLGRVAAVALHPVSPVDGKSTLDNPGCGFANGWWTDLAPDCPTNGEDLCATSANCVKFWSLHKFSKGYAYQGDYEYYTNHIVSLVGGADIPLTENALLAVSNSLLKCRRNGGTCIPHFAYTPDRWGGAEPDDFSIILMHIRQLGAVISQFSDVVPAVECGIIGAWGEMHTSRYADEPYQSQIVGEWLENLPSDMPLLVRSPPVWMRYLRTTTSQFFDGGMYSMDQTLRARMGFFNHGYLGTDDDYGTWNNGGRDFAWTRDQARVFLRGQSVPYGGELAYVSNEFFNANCHLLDPVQHNVVSEWYDTHLSYLRNIHSSDNTVYKKLAAVTFGQDKWAFDGMPNLSEYEGIDLRKFCEDHMGYRYIVRGVSFSGYPGHGCLDVEIENTGFGQLLFDDEVEILLSGAGGLFAMTSHNGVYPSVKSIRGGTSASLTFEFDYPASLAPGDYDILLRVWTPLADEQAGSGSVPRRPVRFANEGVWNGDIKANLLCGVSLDRTFDMASGEEWFSWSAPRRTATGGSWADDEFVGEHLSRKFDIDSRIPRGKTGEVCVDMQACAMNEIPCPDGGVASFVFLGDVRGKPIPHGYCAEGWKRLWGFEAESGQRVVLRIRVSGNCVSYGLNDAQLCDESGRTWLPAVADASAVGELSLVGDQSDYDRFLGTFLANGCSPFFIMTIR